MVMSPFFQAQKLGDTPGPDLIGACRQKFRLRVVGVAQLPATLPGRMILGQDAVHRPDRTEVTSVIQQLGKELVRRLVNHRLTVEQSFLFCLLFIRKLARIGSANRWDCRDSRFQPSIVGRTRGIQGMACPGDSDLFSKLLGCDHSVFSSSVGLVLASSSPKTIFEPRSSVPLGVVVRPGDLDRVEGRSAQRLKDLLPWACGHASCRQLDSRCHRRVLAPVCQLRSIESFASKQFSDRAEFGAPVGFLHNAKPVFRIESASLDLFRDLSGGLFGNVFVC